MERELYKKDRNDPDNQNGVFPHSPRARHPGGEVKWVFGSTAANKASGGDVIQAE